MTGTPGRRLELAAMLGVITSFLAMAGYFESRVQTVESSGVKANEGLMAAMDLRAAEIRENTVREVEEVRSRYEKDRALMVTGYDRQIGFLREELVELRKRVRSIEAIQATCQCNRGTSNEWSSREHPGPGRGQGGTPPGQ